MTIRLKIRHYIIAVAVIAANCAIYASVTHASIRPGRTILDLMLVLCLILANTILFAYIQMIRHFRMNDSKYLDKSQRIVALGCFWPLALYFFFLPIIMSYYIHR